MVIKPGPRNMLDAWIDGVSVREFSENRGTQVGNAGGLGKIILLRPITEPVIEEVPVWPE